MGVKSGVEEGTGLLHAKFHPHRCNDKGVGPQELKFLLRFDRNVEYKRPAGAYPCAIFTKFADFFFTSFQDVLRVKILLDLLKGLWSYEGFNLRGSGCPQIFSGETTRQTPNVLEVQERARGPLSITMPSLVGLGASDFTRRRGGQKR